MNQATRAAAAYEINDSELLVLLADKAGRFVYANPAYAEASGCDWTELKGTEAGKQMHADNPPQVLADMTVTLRGGQPWTGIIKNRRRNGDFYWVRLNISPLYAKGKYAGALMVHSKATHEEIATFEPLYRMMREGANRNLALRHGKVFRANALGKAIAYLRSFGLNGTIFSAAVSSAMIGIGCLSAVTPSVASPGFWLASAVLAAGIGATSLFLSQSIVKPLRNSVRFANKTAAGDLDATMTSTREDEVGALIRALSQMSINMRATVLDVRDGVSLMTQATAEIAAGTLELADRTEAQSSSLEQAAAAMEEIHTTVMKTADAARQASDVASSASSAAEAGGHVVDEVIATMNGIAKSSKKMSDIVGVIDSIAFQTNILALNAAVEAARAGEQGRGFAVVAAEVRNLAQRSATSAREIKTLIAESVSKISDGSRLVNSAGKAIEGVVVQVKSVTELVTRIANASSEQSIGVGRINQGMAQLDEMTHQNSALVEENSSAAESLRVQSERLAEAVSVFKLSREETLALFNAAPEAPRKEPARPVADDDARVVQAA